MDHGVTVTRWVGSPINPLTIIVGGINFMICEKCGKEFKEDYRKDRKSRKLISRFCSRSCANSKNQSKETNEKRRDSLKVYLKSEAFKKRDRKTYISICSFCGKSFEGKRKTCSDMCFRSSLSEKRSLFIETKGGGGFLDILWYDIVNIEGTTFKVRGTWELKYAQWLNSKGILWSRGVSFKYKRNDNILRTYIPDFYFPLTEEFKEVKGYFSEEDKEKIRLVEEQNRIKIEVLFKENLEELGIFL